MPIVKSAVGFLIATIGNVMLSGISGGVLYLLFIEEGKTTMSFTDLAIITLVQYAISLTCHYIAFRLIPMSYLKWLIVPMVIIAAILWRDDGLSTMINLGIVNSMMIVGLFYWMKKSNQLTSEEVA